MVRFEVLSTGYRCDDTIDRCIKSVQEQTYQNVTHRWKVDGEGKERFGKMFNFFNLAKQVPGDHVICDLDLDDHLEPDALETVAKEYEANPNLLMTTYGSYRMESGRPARFNGAYTSDKFRGLAWRGTHLKTFKASLFHKIKIESFKGPPDGGWLMVCADLAMMWPMMEIAGLDRIKFIDKPIYIYNDLSDLNDHKTQGAMQKRVEKWLRSRKPYKRLK